MSVRWPQRLLSKFSIIVVLSFVATNAAASDLTDDLDQLAQTGEPYLLISPIFNEETGEFEYKIITVDNAGNVTVVASYNMLGDWTGAGIGGAGPLGDMIAENGWSVHSGSCGAVVACLNAVFGN